MPQIITKERFKLISASLYMSIKDSDLEGYYTVKKKKMQKVLRKKMKRLRNKIIFLNL